MTDMIRWTPTLFEAQAGAFSSDKRYIRRASSGGYALASGATVEAVYYFESVNTRFVKWRCKIGSVLDVSVAISGLGPVPAEPTPTVETVDI